MKILITWIGFNEDFIKTPSGSLQISAKGFTSSLHKDIYEAYKFEKHIILCTTDSSNQISKELEVRKYLLRQYLKDIYGTHNVEFADSGIDKGELQNFPIIESHLRNFLQRFDATEELHVVAGTGPTSVSMAWCTLSLSMEDKLQLHVMQLPEYASEGNLSLLKEIKPHINKLLDNKLREKNLNIDLPHNIYKDEIILKEYETAEAIAPAIDVNVLILGETGCGKDLLAERIVEISPLPRDKYKAINCASLSDDLLGSELFGHVKGAFTGANDHRKGLFEECNGGTLFLDEIGDISKFMQQSLLRAIENKQIKKIGGNQIINNVRVRIIAATNNNLYGKCRSGKFRWDLYYRLCSMEIELESYRTRTKQQRNGAIKFYIQQAEIKWNRKIIITEEALEIIKSYSFPGNFREINNSINALFALGIKTITKEVLPKRFTYTEALIDESYESVLKKHCISLYQKYNYDLAASRKALGYKNSTQLKNKLIEWGVYKDE